jgi:hypothetical protein
MQREEATLKKVYLAFTPATTLYSAASSLRFERCWLKNKEK